MKRIVLFDFANVLGVDLPQPEFVLAKEWLTQAVENVPDYLYLNKNLLAFLANHTTDANYYLYSNSSPSKLHLIKELFPDIFTNVISAQETGWYKSDPESYIEIAKLLKVESQEIIFVDDLIDNIKAAQAAGVQVIHFQSTTQTITQLNELLIAST